MYNDFFGICITFAPQYIFGKEQDMNVVHFKDKDLMEIQYLTLPKCVTNKKHLTLSLLKRNVQFMTTKRKKEKEK